MVTSPTDVTSMLGHVWRSFSWIACWAALSAACGGLTAADSARRGDSAAAPDSPPDSAGDAGGAPESGIVSTPNCGGLGCPLCDADPNDPNRADGLCTTTQACTTNAQCSAPPSEQCVSNGPDPGTVDFYPASCLGGYCAYLLVTSATCSAGCSACAGFAMDGACAFSADRGACGNCCWNLPGAASYSASIAACACGSAGPCSNACAASPICGGTVGESNGCIACLETTLVDGGACVSNAAFQASCIATDGGCATFAQCLVGCQ